MVTYQNFTNASLPVTAPYGILVKKKTDFDVLIVDIASGHVTLTGFHFYLQDTAIEYII